LESIHQDLKVKTAVLLEPLKRKANAPPGEPVQFSEREVDIELVQCGDLLKIVRGSSVPVDAEVVEVHGGGGEGDGGDGGDGGGRLTVDESMLTGESMPVPKQVQYIHSLCTHYALTIHPLYTLYTLSIHSLYTHYTL
jgi:cation transport ATPase